MLQNKVLKDTSRITPAVQTILRPIQVKRMSGHLTKLRSDPVLKQDEPMEVQIVNMAAHPNPKYATEGASGMDLCANVTGTILLAPNQWVLIPTGIHIALPKGVEAQIRSRSGMAAKRGVTVLNSPGTIDQDYRGELKVLLMNFSDKIVTIRDGERIAQLAVTPYI